MIKRMLCMMLVVTMITAIARGQQEKKIQAPLLDKSSSRNMKWEFNNNVTSQLFQRLPASTDLSFTGVSMELSGLDLSKKTQLTETSLLESTAGGSFVTIVQEDFEGAFPSGLWQVFDGDGSTNGEYYWDATAYKSKSPSHSAWCAKGGANGLNPPANYPNNCKSWMVYGPFDLSDANWAAVQFSFWIDTQANYDYISWMASTNGTNFYGYSISGFGGETTWLDWLFNLRDVYTLGDVTGNSSVWIAFLFTSNSSIADRGVYLDDIILKKALLDTLEIVSSFPSPGSSPSGLAWDGTYLWNADWSRDMIYKLTTLGSIVSSFSSPGSAPNGLTWDGSHIWNADWNTVKIYKLTTSGNPVSSFPSPGSGPDGLTWDGSYLWNSDFNTATIYKLTTTGSKVSSFPAPGGPGSTAGGLAWDGTNLWHADWTTSIIYKLDTSGNVLDLFLAPGTNPDGLTWDGTFLWNADFEKDTIYQLSVGLLPNYLVDIFPASQDSSALIGSTISYIETIKNIGQLADSYNLFLSGNLWPTSIWDASGSQQITNTGIINPGSQLDIQIKVTIPTTASPVDQDVVQIIATSVANPSISDSALIITRSSVTIPWSDNFATTTLDPVKWPYNTGYADINTAGLNEPSAPYSLNLDGYNASGDEVRSQVIDLSAESKIVLSYYYQRTGGGESPDSGDDLWVDYYNASGNWINLRQYFGSGPDMSNFVKEEIILPADAYHSSFRFRFRNSATKGNYDDWFIDDVSLTGAPEITYSPQSFSVTVNAGDSTTRTLTIGNIGYTDLEFILGLGSTKLNLYNTPAAKQKSLEDCGSGSSNSSFSGVLGSGSVIHQIPSPGPLPNGLTWDGSYLWNADHSTKTIYMIDTSDGSIINYFPAPGGNDPSDMAWDGKHLWHIDFGTKMIYKLNPANGAVISSFVNPGEDSEGLTWDGQYLWVGDWSPQVIYQVDTVGTVIRQIPAPGHVDGLAWDGRTLWVSTTDDFIHRVGHSDGTVLQSFACPASNSNSLTFDGEFLWNDNSNTKMIYKIDVDFIKAVEWLSFTPESGTVPTGGSQDIIVKFNAKRFNDDTTVYANIIITSNDPDSSIAIIPASMTVISTGDVFVSCPDTLGAPGDFIDIPIFVSDVTGLDIYSAGIKIQTDANILIPQGANMTGTIANAAGWGTPNWGITGGEITIAMAGTMPLSGKGVLVYIRYQVSPGASEGQTTAIQLTKVVFNEGQPGATTHDGSFIVHAGYDLTGNIGYYYNDKPVANALVSLICNTSQNTISDSIGYYQFTDIPYGNCTVRPAKEKDQNQAISPFDASMILRYYVGTISLNPYQMIAADVSGNGDITAYDASLIQRYFVGLIKAFPVMPDTTHFWCFVPGDFVINDVNWSLAPDSIRYEPLHEDKKDQDYVGIVYGDVSGNWAPSTLSLASNAKNCAKSVNVSLGEKTSDNGKSFNLPILIDDGAGIMSAGFCIGYDLELLKLVTVTTSPLTSDYSLVFNTENDEIRIALAGAKALTQKGSIAQLVFELVEEQHEVQTTISIKDININEGQIAATSTDLKLDLAPIIPNEFDLSQNYPNPFNPVTTIKYQIPERSHVVVKVLNVLGQKIRTLVNEEKEPGYYDVTWDSKNESGQSVTTGIYFYYIEAGDFSCIKKMALLR